MAIPLNPDNVPKDLVCPICFNVPLKPRILKACSHVFCKDCIKESLFRNQECPVCRCKCKSNQVLLLEKNGLANRMWANIVVKCGHDADGCKWKGCISDYELHDSVCPKNRLRKEIDSLKKEIKQLKRKLQDEGKRIRQLTQRSDMLATAKEELEKIVRRFHRESSTALESSSDSGSCNIDTSGSDSSDSTIRSDSSDSEVVVSGEYISASFTRSSSVLRPRRSSRRNH